VYYFEELRLSLTKSAGMIAAASILEVWQVKPKTFFSACATAVALLCLAGCGSYDLKSIELTPSGTNLKGIGSQISLKATGNYSNFTSKDLTQRVTYNVTVTTSTPPSVDAFGGALPTPPAGIQLIPGPMLTAVTPAVCTWDNANTSTTGTPAWVITGSYTVTATFSGVTSNPVYISVASAAGNGAGNTAGQCGP
jgi:hypothetical protein